MSPLLPIGLGAMVGGQILSGIGEHQGARAMSGQASRQAGEEANARAQEQELLRAEIDRINAEMGSDTVSPQIRTQTGAVAGVNRFGKAAGADPATLARVRLGLLNRGAATAQADAAGQQVSNRGIRLGQTRNDISRVRQDQANRRLSYEGARNLAGQEHGFWFRQGGNILSAAGVPLTMIGMMGGGSPTPGAAGAPGAAGVSTIAGNEGSALFDVNTGGGAYSGPQGFSYYNALAR